jgi:hypothetical protein
MSIKELVNIDSNPNPNPNPNSNPNPNPNHNPNPDQLYIIYHLLSSCFIDFLGQIALSCYRSSVTGHGRLFIIGQG